MTVKHTKPEIVGCATMIVVAVDGLESGKLSLGAYGAMVRDYFNERVLVGFARHILDSENRATPWFTPADAPYDRDILAVPLGTTVPRVVRRVQTDPALFQIMGSTISGVEIKGWTDLPEIPGEMR